MFLTGGAPAAKVELKEVREKQALARSQLLRAAAGFIPESGFRQRRAYFSAKVQLCEAAVQPVVSKRVLQGRESF